MTSKYKNLEKSKKHFSKVGWETICSELIRWDNQLINKLENNGKFTHIDIDYIIQLLKDDKDFIKRKYLDK